MANYVSINVGGPSGSIGKPLPWFAVKLVDEQEVEVPQGETGEILVKGKREAYTSVSLNKVRTRTQDGWIQTGDLGCFDAEGYLYFTGRKSDSLRRRGENVSAWEVERIVVRHPSVEECALIGVESGLGAGDDDLKLFVKLKATEALEPLDLIKWSEDKMPTSKYLAISPLCQNFQRRRASAYAKPSYRNPQATAGILKRRAIS